MNLKRIIAYVLGGITILVIGVAILAPTIVKSLGLHPDFDSKQYNLEGNRALIVTTSHGVLNKPGDVPGAGA